MRKVLAGFLLVGIVVLVFGWFWLLAQPGHTGHFGYEVFWVRM